MGVVSADPPLPQRIKAPYPRVVAGVVYPQGVALQPTGSRWAGARVIRVRWGSVRPETVAMIHRRGLLVNGWKVNEVP